MRIAPLIAPGIALALVCATAAAATPGGRSLTLDQAIAVVSFDRFGLAGARNAAAALETMGQRIDASCAAREATEIQLSAERDRYAAGLSTNFLVLTRQNDLSPARLDEIAARTDYRKALTELARATGSLLRDRGIDIEGVTNG